MLPCGLTHDVSGLAIFTLAASAHT